MKPTIKFSLLAIATLLCSIAANAHDFVVNGIYYNKLTSSTVSVTYRGSSSNEYDNEYTGNITIPSSVKYGSTTYTVTSIGSSAFSGCSGLTSVTIPNSVTSIGNEAFWYCSSLTSITIPNSVTSIGNHAFYACSGLTCIVVKEGNTVYDSRENCNAIIETATNTLISGCQSTVIPNSVTSIGIYAFYKCSGLTSVTIPNSVTSIGKGAFYYCSSLTSVTIPNSVMDIGGMAFRDCSSLEAIFLLGDTYPTLEMISLETENSVFDSNHESRKFYVLDPEKCKNAEGWSKYADDILPYVTFKETQFTYSGHIPEIPYTHPTELGVNTDNVTGIDVGTYETTIKISYNGATVCDIPYTYTITPAPLTLSVNDAERTYGDDNPAFSYSLTGFVNNENESVLTTPVTLSTPATATSTAGTYAINATAAAKNYTIEVDKGTLTVKKAPLTVKANNKSRTYGDANPQFDVSYIGLKNGESTIAQTSPFNISTTATAKSDAGIYPITVTGGVSNNYEFIEYLPGELTVGKAPLTIAVQSTARSYGEENPTFKFSYSGFRNGDTEANLLTPPAATTPATPTSSVGNYTLTPNGATSNNYDIAYTNGTLTVEKALLTIRANNATRMYGDENPAFTFTYTGFKNQETEAALAELPTATSVNVTAAVGNYDIVPAGAMAQNYAINYANGVLAVTKAPLSVAVTDCRKTYGDENPRFGLTYSGFRNGDDERCIATAPAVTTNATVASGAGIYVLMPEGGTAQNYEFTAYKQGTLTVEKAALTLIADDMQRLYFEENPTFTFHGEGWKNGDTESCLTVQPTFACTAKKVSGAGVYEISLQGANAKNYVPSYTAGTLTVGKREVTVTVNDAEKIYGEDNPAFGVKYEGFVNNETEKVLTSPVVVQCEAEKMSDAGSYEITASGAEAANYDFIYTTGTLTIGKATQEIIWEQELTDIPLGTQIPLEAVATSGLEVEYEVEENDIISLYEAGGKLYIDCAGYGKVVIKAIQPGNRNYHAATRIYKTLTIIDPTGVETVEGDDAAIYTADGRIVVENASADILVYDLTGRLVKSVQSAAVRTEIPMETPGIYFVRTGVVTKKVKL
ncbi:MAG: leucine-rich repeat protein [Bacteroidaceae bacterium]|nr:leucine-rich repeat protein [Bacteroidaceae bacterium]